MSIGNNNELDISYLDKFYKKITRFFLRFLFFCLTITLSILISLEASTYNIVTVVIFLALFLAMDYIVSSDTYSLVFGMSLWSLVILVTNFSWNLNGIYNSSIIMLPGAIMLAIIFNQNTLAYCLLAFIILTCIMLGVGHTENIITLQGVEKANVWPRVTFTIILIVVLSGMMRYFFIVIEEYLKSLQRKLKIYKKLHERYKSEIGFDKQMQMPTEYSCNHVFSEFIKTLNSPSSILSCQLITIKNIDQLKFSLGHNIAIKLLALLGQKLTEFNDNNTRAFLFRGNEFVILSKVKGTDDADKLAHRILLCITESMTVEDHEIELIASIGVALAPYDGMTLDALLKAAHQACDQSNNAFSSSYIFFNEAMRAKSDFNYLLIKDMKQALINGEFELHYQPKIHLENSKVTGVEALIRWNKKGKGMIPPDLFIPLAEESGLIVEIGKWVLREACTQCKQWHQQGLPKLTIAVNVSPIQFRKGNFPYIVMQALHDADLKPEFLEIEITESALGDQYLTVRSQIINLASKGISIAVDDFGTGYSNLGYLNQFNISCLKIDQSFIRNSHNNYQDLHIIKAIIEMSKGLGIYNVAEGVEELEHLQLLKVLGCAYGQGYYWSKPLANSQFIEFMHQHLLDQSH